MTRWWLPPSRCPCPNTEFFRVLGLEEAGDVSLHLQPLQALLDEIEQADYSQVSDTWQSNQAQPGGLMWAVAEPQRLRGHPPLALPWPCTEQALLPQVQPFVPKVLCSVCLLRAHCVYYHSPAHIARLLQEVCNFFINLVQPQGHAEPALLPPLASLGLMWRVQLQ